MLNKVDSISIPKLSFAIKIFKKPISKSNYSAQKV